MTRTVFDNHMTAHVWAQLTQPEGRSSNGNFYFDGPTLFSYGRHFVAGYVIPAAPEEGEEARPLLTLINGDSYSISTGRHLSYAQSAARGQSHRVPGLTALAREMHRHAWEFVRTPAKGLHRAPAPMKARRAALPELRNLLTADPAPVSVMGAIFRAFGATPSEAARWALKAEKDAAKATTAARNKVAAERRTADAEKAKRYAARPVADTLAELAADMARPHFRAERAESEWREEAREMHRAKAEAKRRGWAGIARAIEGHRKAIFATLPDFEAREIFNARRAVVSQCRGEIRAAITGADDLKTASVYDRASNAAERLAGFAWVASRARVMGCPDLPARLMTLAADLAAKGRRAYAGEERAAARARLQKIRTALHVAAQPATDDLRRVAIRLAALSEGHAAARDFSGAFSTVPRIFAAAGWTRETFKALADQLKAAADSIRADKAAAILDLAREEWRAAGAVTPETQRMAKECGGAISASGFGSYQWGRGLDDGAAKPGALLRAVGVERDAAGAIVAGELVTSQAARVPLAHAIRVFRFLKRQRAAGEAWEANGKTLPVGHFRVELVTAEGSFKAGCHWINWPEVARLADSLGLADLAAEDTRETRAHA